MRVLVTGANGYIGRHVVKALLDRGASVAAVDFTTDDIPNGADKFNLDIFDRNVQVCATTDYPDAVIHMAWKDGFVHNSPAHMSNLSAHYEFCTRIVECGIKTLAIMGSMHEIGYWEGAIDENTPCTPLSQYGVAKNALRQSLLLSLKDKINLQWLRAYYIYGDDKRASSVFAKLTAAEERGDKVLPFTSGKNKFDFITVERLAEQIAACVLQDKIIGIINCCTGKPLSLVKQVEGYIKEHGFKIKLDYGAFPDRPYDSPCVWGDNTKIKKIMGDSY
ncbi:MAG: NAD(P)-dependent oxidoreductase [Clostridiales bacterium]|jgi:dTDP-6-deoxy-L-talose 4-dehydrogenase (NAD+)|nr:NAD(P)-dependent oxidoreductase [Clostridiales bacterium]